MEKKEIIDVLREAQISHSSLVNDGQILLDGLNLETIEQPVDPEDCKFTTWFNDNDIFLNYFPWFQGLKDIHDKILSKYRVLFFESMRKYNPKTFGQLTESHESLKDEYSLFHKISNEIITEMEVMSEDDYNKFLPSSNSSTNETLLINDEFVSGDISEPSFVSEKEFIRLIDNDRDELDDSLDFDEEYDDIDFVDIQKN